MIKISSFRIICIGVFILIFVSLCKAFFYPQRGVAAGTQTLNYKSFSIAPNNSWDLISYDEYPDGLGEQVRFSQRLGAHEIIDVYIKSSNRKDEKDGLIRLPVFFNGRLAEKYIATDCGAGKSMGSFCEYIVFSQNDKWYTLFFFDYGGQIGRVRDEKIFKEFISTFQTK